MKKSMGLLFSAALLGVGLATVGTTVTVHAADTNGQLIATQKVTVSDKSGFVYHLADETAIPGYTDAALTQATGKNIQGTTEGHSWMRTYQYDQVAKDAAGTITAYHFSDGWAAAKLFSVTDPTTYKVNARTGVGTISSTQPIKVYSDPQLTKATGKTLAGGSRWQYFAAYDVMVTMNGQQGVADSLAYNLGGNQWVSREDFALNSGSQFTTAPSTGMFVLITNPNGAKLYSDVARTKATGRTLPYGSRWQTSVSVSDCLVGDVGFGLGGAQYVNEQDVGTYSDYKTVFTVKYAAHPTWGIAVYNSKLQVVKTIPAGSRWRTFSWLNRTSPQSKEDPQIYLNIGGDQWVKKDYGVISPK